MIYFFNTSVTSNYCNYKSDWNECSGKVIKISGNNPNAEGGVMQHPIMTISSEIVGNDSKKFQGYLDTNIGGQIVLLSNEEINCPNKMTIIGMLETNVGPCDVDGVGRDAYCGSSITVHQWKCD